jgi:hypothetical protein
MAKWVHSRTWQFIFLEWVERFIFFRKRVPVRMVERRPTPQRRKQIDPRLRFRTR